MDDIILAACTLVQRVDGKFLALHSEERQHSIPGGKLEPGENHKQAAERETLEETGYEVVADKDIAPFLEGSVKRRGELAGRRMLTTTYLAKALGMPCERLHTHEGDVVWVTEEQLCTDSAYASYNKHMFNHFRVEGHKFIGDNAVTRVFKDLGYTIVASIEEHRLDFKVYSIAGELQDGTLTYEDDFSMTEVIEDADVAMDGHVKWDGCSNWSFPSSHSCMLHFCDRDGLLNMGIIMTICFDMTEELCPNWNY